MKTTRQATKNIKTLKLTGNMIAIPLNEQGEALHPDDKPDPQTCEHELGRYAICKKCGAWPPALQK